MIEIKNRNKLKLYLDKWIKDKIENELESLIKLKNIRENNSQIRALAYILYESNGVIKRETVKNFLIKLSQDDRKILRNLGVKFGRYHIFLFKLFKPDAVSLRIILWKNYHQKYFELKPPTFGLNFLNCKNSVNKDFMLLCGFENFDKFYVRIDILERLFLLILNSNKDNENEIKLLPEMMNLLGCNRENFVKLLKKMNYRVYEKNKDIFFKYVPARKNMNSKKDKTLIDSPFRKLEQLNLK